MEGLQPCRYWFNGVSLFFQPLRLIPLILVCVGNVDAAFYNLTTIPFDQGYTPLFGDGNLVRSPDGKGTSNADVFEKNHDELDIEFLGNIEGKPWRFQTNLYGNGSTNRGREERYRLWFDPTKDFHRYSILWTPENTIEYVNVTFRFYVDEVPIREVVRNEEMGADYPSKPMSLYTTIWDASSWATSGGQYKVNYKYAPFVAEFKDLVLEGCPADPIQQIPAAEACAEHYTHLATQDYSVITRQRRAAMRRFRQRYMYYSYCYDSLRYPVPPSECVTVSAEKARFKDTGRLKFGGSHKRQSKRRSRNRNRAVPNSDNAADV
ncbi:unnamed protein product [Malus baccata var. baccata]